MHRVFQLLCDTGGLGADFCRPSAGKNLRRDHRRRTRAEKPGAGPIFSIPVVEAISVVMAAAEDNGAEWKMPLDGPPPTAAVETPADVVVV